MSKCPHVKTSREGTSYCDLAENAVRCLSAQLAQEKMDVMRLKSLIQYAMGYVDRETYEVLETALKPASLPEVDPVKEAREEAEKLVMLLLNANILEVDYELPWEKYDDGAHTHGPNCKHPSHE